jgi:hypothetical protein
MLSAACGLSGSCCLLCAVFFVESVFIQGTVFDDFNGGDEAIIAFICRTFTKHCMTGRRSPKYTPYTPCLIHAQYIHTHTHTHTRAYIYTTTQRHTQTHTHSLDNANTQTLRNTNTDAHRRTHTHTHTHTIIHT